MAAKKRNGRGGARPGSGPKPKPISEKQRHPVMIKLTDGEMEDLEAAASDTPLGAYVRRVLLRHLARRRK